LFDLSHLIIIEHIVREESLFSRPLTRFHQSKRCRPRPRRCKPGTSIGHPLHPLHYISGSRSVCPRQRPWYTLSHVLWLLRSPLVHHKEGWVLGLMKGLLLSAERFFFPSLAAHEVADLFSFTVYTCSLGCRWSKLDLAPSICM